MATDVFTLVKKQLKRHEGFRALVYKDTQGIATIGYGRNVDHKGITTQEAEMLLENDIKDAIQDAKILFQNFESLSEHRKSVLVNMAFNLGRNSFSAFVNFRQAVESEQWALAAQHGLDSRWATQVGNRAKELMQILANDGLG